MTRLIAHRDQSAVDELRLRSVVLDRRGEVWQVLLVRHGLLGPTRGWFRLGDGSGIVYGAGVVADQGPLRVLFDRGADIPENVTFCAHCEATTDDPESDSSAPSPCIVCSGAGWFIDGEPITLAEVIDRTAALAPSTAVQALLPPISLAMGMTVIAEPKAAHVGTAPRVRGRVIDVREPLNERDGVVELVILDDAEMRTFNAPIVQYSFRPVEDA